MLWSAYSKRLNAWRAAARRGRGGSKPEPPKFCGEDTLIACCGTMVPCGERHGHPSDEEERGHDEALETIHAEHERLRVTECYVCEGPASHYEVKGKPLCAPCTIQMLDILQRKRASGG